MPVKNKNKEELALPEPEIVEEQELFPVPEDPYKFLEQILDSAPEDFVTVKKVIGIGKVEYHNHPSMTAAVANTRPYTLIFGKEFMQKNMQSMDDCVFILWHELTHLVLDHFAKDILDLFLEKGLGKNHKTVLAEQTTHIVVDCQVNATCYHSLKDDCYMEFIKRYYSKTEMPFCMLRPDGEPPTPELQAAHEKLYSLEGISNSELIDALTPWAEENKEKMKEFIKQLLGNHKDLFKDRVAGNEEDSIKDLADAVAIDITDILDDEMREALEEARKAQGDKEQEDGPKPGQGGERRKYEIQTIRDKISHARELAKKLKKAYTVSASSRIHSLIDSFYPKRASRTVIPNFHDRRTGAIYGATGSIPVFHKVANIGSKTIVPCYVDVSGSQNHVIKHVLPVVSRLRQKVGNVVYCFSTYVHETQIADLARGKYESDGGTDFNPVIKHMLKHRFRNALILTDGQAYLSDDLKEELRRRGIIVKVGWTVGKNEVSLEPLSSIAKEEVFVFGEEGPGRER